MMAFLCLETREAIVSKSTQHPNSAWVVRQTKEFLEKTRDRDQKPAILMHDRDTKFSRAFTAASREGGLRTNPLPVASPNLNGRCERLIQTLKHELLFKFILFGTGTSITSSRAFSGTTTGTERTWSVGIFRRWAPSRMKSRSRSGTTSK
jgi:hypothetical protein